jgi:Leucine-rich repeat (LRR) protein
MKAIEPSNKEATTLPRQKFSFSRLFPRFSLRTLLALVGVICIVLVTWIVPSVRQYQAAEKLSSSMGGSWAFEGEDILATVNLALANGTKVEHHWSDHLFRRVDSVMSVSLDDVGQINCTAFPHLKKFVVFAHPHLDRAPLNTNTTDSLLKQLAHHKKLQWLSIAGFSTSSSGLAEISELTNLEKLNFEFVHRASGDDLTPLKKLTNLKELTITFFDSEVDSAVDFAPIGKLTNLESLELRSGRKSSVTGLGDLKKLSKLTHLTIEVEIKDDDLVPLAALKKLDSLTLKNCKFKDEALVHLKDLANLRELHLNYNKIDGSGLKHLTELPQLRVLNLYGNGSLGNAAIGPLLKLQQLEKLEVRGTLLNKDDTERLRSLPNLEHLSQ